MAKKEIYVFGPDDDANDYSTMGLAGALEPTECTFSETKNGDSSITMTHPLDEWGKYKYLVKGNILNVPVPVCLCPEIQNDSVVTTVWEYAVKPLEQLTSKNQRTIYKKKSGSGKIKVLGEGEKVVVTLKPEDTEDTSRWKVTSEYGEGWINPDGFDLVTTYSLDNNSGSIQEVISPWVITYQYFRISKVTKQIDGISIEAKHISYDLLYNMTRYSKEESYNLGRVIYDILADCYAEHDFTAVTNVSNAQSGLTGWKRKNPIDAFLDPEEGVCKKFNVNLVRNNHTLYFLHDPGINRGIRIEYGKNMTGISFVLNDDEVVTRIIPIGQTKDDEDLFLSDEADQQYVDSDRINDYPVIHTYELSCDNCKVGETDENGGKVTTEIARARMKAQAEKLYSDDKVDQPTVEMTVEFINLGDTEEYEQFKGLEDCFLYDYISVTCPSLSIDVTAQITQINWDCILLRMNSVAIGSVGRNLANAGITTWQIPSGVSGSKIAEGTIGGSTLASSAISARHIQAESIGTTALVAESVTSEKIAAGAITADKIAAGAITAEKITAGSIDADKITAGAITADKIAAGSITAQKIAANTIEANNIKTGTITAESGIIANGAIGTAQIADGSITEAKVVSLNADVIKTGTLSVERLILKGEDGLFRAINATDEGLTSTQLSEEQYQNAISGTVLVARSITADKIAAKSITSNEILAGTITASLLNVNDIFSDTAFTNALTTSEIFANGGTLTIMASNVAKANLNSRIFRQESEPTAAVAKENDLWYVPSSDTWYTATDITDGTITWTETAFSDLVAREDAEAAGSAASDAADTAEAAYNAYKDAVTRPEFERVVRVSTDGLHVGDNLTGNEVLIDSGSVNIVINGMSYSKFGANYLQLGDDMRIRRPTVGGVAFTPIVG